MINWTIRRKSCLGRIFIYDSTLKNLAFIFLLLFAFTQCLSNALANTAMGFSVFFSVLYCIQTLRKRGFAPFKNKLSSQKNLLIVFGALWICLFFSALSSGHPNVGLKVWFGQFIYRTFPLFAMLFIFSDRKAVQYIVLAFLTSCFIDVVAGMCIGPTGNGRIKGLFGHHMTMAGFLCISIPLTFALLFFIPFKKFIWKFNFFFLYLIIFITGALLNGTRGAWIALSISLILIGIWSARKSWRKLLGLFVFILGIVTLFGMNDSIQRRAESITSITYQSNTERLLMWESALEMFEDDPYFGVGLGQYGTSYREKYIQPEAKERFQNHAHSNIFQMLGENGIVGLLGFLTLWSYIFFHSLYYSVIKGRDPFCAVIFTCSLCLFIQGLTEYNFGNSAVIKFYWLFLGCMLVGSDIYGRKNAWIDK